MPEVKQKHYELLETIVTRRLRETGLSISDIATQLHNELEFGNPLSAKGKLYYFAKGFIYGGTTNKPVDPEKHLRRLSVFLYALGVEESDPAIFGLKDIDARLEYPPKNYDTLPTSRDLLKSSS